MKFIEMGGVRAKAIAYFCDPNGHILEILTIASVEGF